MLVRIQPREPQSVAQSGSVLRLERKSREFESHLTDQFIEDWYIGFVPGTLNPMNLVRIQNPQPFLLLSVSLNIRELRNKVSTYLRVIGEIGSVAWLVD